MGAADALPLLFVLVVWFVSTGAIIWLDGLPRWTFRWSLLGATIAVAAAVWAIVATATDTSAAGSYVAFGAALAIWGWHEMAFLMGFVTGPRKAQCPPNARGWTRFKLAAATLIWHEVAMAATALAMLALTWGQPNQLAAATFGTLFVMRLSTKLNIFLGVPNLTVDFLPPHLAYLKSYFRVRACNWLFPVSIAATGYAAVWLGARAMTTIEAGGNAAGETMLFALVALAILEHWFLVLPLPDAALWRWAVASKAGHAK